jgi:hypothetical protein
MSRSTKLRALVLALAIAGVAFGGVTPASAAKGGTDRPLKVSGSATGPIAWGTTFDFHLTSRDIASLSGKSTGVSDGNLFDGVTVAETAANGDTTYSELVAVLPTTATCPPVSNAVFETPFINEFMITGGTGRFAGASGGYTLSGCASVVPDSSSLTGFTYNVTYTGVGTVSY